MFIWTIGDAIGALAIGVLIIGVVINEMTGWWKQFRCKHDDYRENRACHAICKKCDKDLGFIGNLRK